MQQTILPHQLPQALDGRPGVKMLSLDCFDTLLWRDTHAPTDLFALLEGVTPGQRVLAEQAARKARVLAHRGSGEVTLREIYAELLPDADAATREAQVRAEVAVEARHCFAFAPTVALMREARRRKLRIVVVSDTYLERDQLEALIRAAAGDAVADLIDTIFCSCEHRTAKGEGLFDVVLRRTGVRAGRILHIGDNPRADLAAATRHGLNALHLTQFVDGTAQRLRQEAVAGALISAGGVAFQPHRATLALGEPAIDDAAEAMGFATAGPLLAAFARWLQAESEALVAARGGKVHLLFLMRDGHLPRLAFEAAVPGVETHAIEISRFTSTAARLRDAEGVRRVVVDEIEDHSGETFLRQLLLNDAEIATLLAEIPAHDRAYALTDAIGSDRWMPRIVERGQAFAARMVEYVRRMVDPAPGDTLMLVDLGYNGSVQNRVDGLFSDAFGVQVAGRYLLLSQTVPSALDKRGLIDERSHDPAALVTFMSAMAVLEQFCTAAQGSVIGYSAEGTAIRAPVGIKGTQSAIRDRIQAGCVRFARADRDAVVRVARPAAIDAQGAAATLARLQFLPLPHELALLSAFEHDVNLGTDQAVALFDPAIAARGMRERGLFYMKDSNRMYLPAELRGQGLATSLSLFAQTRFNLDLRYADFCDREIVLPILVADGNRVFADTVRATPTHEGYHVAAVPVGACRYSIGLQFGRLFEWLQIDAARFLPVTAFLAGEAAAEELGLPALPSCEGVEQVAPHLFRCDGADGFLMVPPPAGAPEGVPMMLTIVFRPLVEREAAPIPAMPAAAKAGFAA